MPEKTSIIKGRTEDLKSQLPSETNDNNNNKLQNNKKWPPVCKSIVSTANSNQTTASSAITTNKTNFSSPRSCLSAASSLSGRSLWSLQQQVLASNSAALFAASSKLSRQDSQLISFSSSSSSSSSKIHRAAFDGYVDMLCEASKRETNAPSKDHHCLTPTLLAAQAGQLEALRILVGRGGNPECVSSAGSSALHLAAARNHLNCVSFLVNFGVNMWALDNELRTAKDLAAIEQCQEVLEYLDQVMAKHSAISTKQVQKLKEKAKQAAEKRLKQVRKAQLKAIKQVERDERQLAKLSHQRRLLRAAHSISDIKLVGRSTESSLISTNDNNNNNNNNQSTSVANYIMNQRLQADLLAQTRRNRTTTTSSCQDQFSELAYDYKLLSKQQHQHNHHHNIKHQNDPGNDGQREFQTAVNKNLENRMKKSQLSNSDLESFSSVSSTSGYLSSCSAKSLLLLKSVAANHFSANNKNNSSDLSTTRSSNLEFSERSTTQQQQQTRPKYSDLVALNTKEKHSHSFGQTGVPAPAASGGEEQRQKNDTQSTTSLALRLKAIGGVSRKVQLRKLLSVASGSTSVWRQSTNQLACSTMNDDDHNDDGLRANKINGPGQKQSGGILKRAKSEPDFGRISESPTKRHHAKQDAIGDSTRPTLDTDEEDEYEAKNLSLIIGETTLNEDSKVSCLPQPPTPPPLPDHSVAAAPTMSLCQPQTKDEQQQQFRQQHLLTQCLSQLKLQHEAISQKNIDQYCQENPAGRLIFLGAESDELIQHQMNAGQLPLRPSVIKNQQKRRIQQNCDHSSACIQNSPLDGNSMSHPNDSIALSTKRDSLNTNDRQSTLASSEKSSSNESSLSCNSSSSLVENIHEMNLVTASQINVDSFLAANGLAELGETLSNERIDFEALLLLSEDDLKSLNILLGPRKKLLNALDRHKAKFIVGSGTPFSVVDIQF